MKQIKLPTFDSMTQCAAISHIPLATMRRAKKSGCAAFSHGRVDLGILLKFIFGQNLEQPSNDPFAELARARAARERQKFEVEDGQLLRKDLVTKFIISSFQPVREMVLALPGIAARVNPADPELARSELDIWSVQFLKKAKEQLP